MREALMWGRMAGNPAVRHGLQKRALLPADRCGAGNSPHSGCSRLGSCDCAPLRIPVCSWLAIRFREMACKSGPPASDRCGDDNLHL